MRKVRKIVENKNSSYIIHTPKSFKVWHRYMPSPRRFNIIYLSWKTWNVTFPSYLVYRSVSITPYKAQFEYCTPGVALFSIKHSFRTLWYSSNYTCIWKNICKIEYSSPTFWSNSRYNKVIRKPDTFAEWFNAQYTNAQKSVDHSKSYAVLKWSLSNHLKYSILNGQMNDKLQGKQACFST